MRKFWGNVNIFELGLAGSAYYAVIFFLLPTLSFFHASFGFALKSTSFSGSAIFLALAGWVSLVLGYFSGLGSKISDRTPSFLGAGWNDKRAKTAFFGTLLGGLTIKLTRLVSGVYPINPSTEAFMESPLYSTVGYLGVFSHLALCIALIMHFDAKRKGATSRFWRVATYATLGLELVLSIPSCSRLAMISPLIIFLVLRSLMFKMDKKAYGVALAVGAIVFLSFSWGNFCRNPKVVVSYEVSNGSSLNSRALPSFLGDSFLSRISQIGVFSKIVKEELAWSQKGFLKDLLTIMGPPRFIWKNKPSVNSQGNEFGRSVGLLSPDDTTTSVGPTHVGDLYMHFGAWGIVFGMALLGILWRFVHQYLMRENSLSGMMFYAVIWIYVVIGLENSVVSVYAGLLKTVALIFVVHLFLAQKEVEGQMREIRASE